ncbi:uncharacterized protein A4U43_C10F3430 [Asparagus officinalis]|uniref:Uncharacterized protein n=1 Tax=Asparagus officinalis TaxID=4686 RepID=A0A5P1E0F4_ASPOF|nr:uncharacterized protein A4U43_C10F3430 [Asparagus officinalis]
MWELEVTSKETITPSSPTPPHLRTHKLCWIDRCVKVLHFPFVLFYQNPAGAHSLPTLKTSLSRTLSIFYPAAGELDPDHTFVDCNDRGAHLVEAVATTDSPLSELVARGLSCCSVNTLLPCSNNSCRNNSGNPLLSVQITTFSWRRKSPSPSASPTKSLMPAPPGFRHRMGPPQRPEEAQPPLPAFNAASLYAQFYKRDGDRPLCDAARGRRQRQAVEAVMARIVVDMRGKAEPPLPDSLFGNMVWQVATAVTEAEAKLKSRFEEKVSSTIKNIDRERLREYTETDGWPLREETVREIADEVGDDWDVYFFTSWTRFGFYEADFGFGRPIWMGIGGPVMRNMVTLTGMEAWVTLEEEDMIRFERDEEILAYTSSYV